MCTCLFGYFILGSPWSASEPSIEPEGPGSTGGVEDNYHRNMSWLHVSVFSCLSMLKRKYSAECY